MNILVTGGSGFIGSHIVDKLDAAGHSVRVFDIVPPHQPTEVDFVRGDITSREDIRRALPDMDVVYHVAAFSDIDLVKANPVATVEHNILGTAYLLEECRVRKVSRIILASSVYAYDEKGHLYTASKLSSELLCKGYGTLYALPFTILRYGTAYGPRSRQADVVSRFVARAIEGEPLIIRGSGMQGRHFTYVEDLAQGSLAALAAVAENKTYTLAAGEPASIRELADLVIRLLDSRSLIEYEAARQDDHQDYQPDTEAAANDLGWRSEVSLEDGIGRYVDWYRREILKSGVY